MRLPLDELMELSVMEYCLRVDAYLLLKEDEYEAEMAMQARLRSYDTWNLLAIKQAIVGEIKGLDEGGMVDSVRRYYYQTPEERIEALAKQNEQQKKQQKEAALTPEERKRRAALKAQADLKELLEGRE